MRNYLLLTLIMIAVASFGQDTNEKITKLKAPSSPASVIVGSQPASISKPKSWEALELGLYTNYYNQNGGFSIPNDYALEFSPYWAQKNLYVPLDDFTRPSLSKSLIQNLSFSVSSTKNFIVNDSLKRDALGFGLRTMLWQGSKQELKAITDGVTMAREKSDLKVLITQAHFKVSASYTTREEYVPLLINELKKNSRKLIEAAPHHLSAPAFQKWLNDLTQKLLDDLGTDTDQFDTELDTITDELLSIDSNAAMLEAMMKDRKGFKLEVAAALALNFPTNKTNLSYVPKYSIWLTPSFQPFDSEHWEFIGVARYNWINQDFYSKYSSQTDQVAHNFDYGLRLVYKLEKLSFELESVGRYSKTIIEKTTDDDGITTERSKSSKDFQYVLNFNYRLTDSIVLSYNFGKQFKPVADAEETLINTFTLNFGIGGPRKEDIVK